jgi:hypothetical protein
MDTRLQEWLDDYAVQTNSAVKLVDELNAFEREILARLVLEEQIVDNLTQVE